MSLENIDLLYLIREHVLSGKEDSDRHLMTLFGLALGYKQPVFLELGVRDGNTTLPLLLAASLRGGALWSVDENKSDFQPPAALAMAWYPRWMDSLDFLNWAVQEHKHYNLVLVDDQHDYDHVCNELVLLDQLVSPRSVILVHDTMYGQSPCYHGDENAHGTWAGGGPYTALMDLDTDIWEWATVPYGHGLTLLRKKYSTRYHSLEDEA